MSDERDTLRAWLDLLGVANIIKKDVDSRLRQGFGLSISRFDVLAALDRAGKEGLTASGLSAHLKVTDGNTTQVTAPLVAAGLVRRSPSPSDGRVAIFSLTPAGRKLFAQMADANRVCIAQAFERLTPSQISTLRRLLSLLKPASLDSDDEAAA